VRAKIDGVGPLKSFRVGEWRVEPTLNQIVRDSDPEGAVKLEPKAMQVLVCLAERAGEVVDKESVIREVWEGAFVSNEVLTNAIWELRRALGDDAKSSVFIQTIPKRGYRLVSPVSGLGEPRIPPPKGSRWWIPALGLLFAGAVVWVLWPRPAPKPVARFALDLPEPLAPFYLPAIAASPDGSRVVYASASGLFLRAVDRMDATFIPGTEGGHGPFFSPDGASVGFFANEKLERVKIDGGSPPVELAVVGGPRGASWGEDGFIYFSPKSNSGLLRVPEEGGDPEPVTELDESAGEWTHRWPDVLPGASAVLVTVAHSDLTSFDDADIVAIDLESGARRLVVEGGSFGRYLSGRLLYSRKGEILEAPFDPRSLETAGPARAVVKDVKLYPINGAAQLSAARDLMVYVPDVPGPEPARLVWSDRKGERRLLLEETRVLYDPALSPDGSKIAISMVTEGNSDLWIYDDTRGAFSRLTATGGEEEHPLFAPGSREITYDYSMAGPFRLFTRAIDGAGEPRELGGEGGNERPESYSPDGKRLVVSEQGFETGYDLSILDLEERTRRTFLATPFDERSARVSPDGRFVAYSSNESGRFEVYATSFPDPGARLQVSVSGGEHPRWTRGGKEIVFLSSEGVVAVGIGTAGGLEAGKPQKLFAFRPTPPRLEGEYRSHYDASSDGERFLLVEGGDDPSSHRLHVVLNWLEERQRAAEPQ
jgi:serine/threonine-protein kinase